MRPLRFGIKTAPQDTTYEEMLAIWQEADAHRRSSSTPGSSTTSRRSTAHLDGPCLEGWTLLAALAARRSACASA